MIALWGEGEGFLSAQAAVGRRTAPARQVKITERPRPKCFFLPLSFNLSDLSCSCWICIAKSTGWLSLISNLHGDEFYTNLVS